MATIINGDSISFSDLTTQKSAANQVVGFKNKIIGGDFTTNPWQRGTSFAAIAAGAYFADRWRVGYTSTAVVTASKAVDAPTAAQAGIFTQHCASLAVTTAQTVIAAGDAFILNQLIEGLNTSSFGFGQAGSRSVTRSFWVKGTKTGIHCVAVRNSAIDRSYVAEYTINTTNTWELKTITIPVDTAGTWLYDTGSGLRLDFTLMAGTQYQAAANTWAAGNFFATANQVNQLDTVGNTFKIALVQLEAGSVATPFDARSIGQELVLCQRYYQWANSSMRVTAAAGDYLQSNINFSVPMRATPSTININVGFVSNVGTVSIGVLTTGARVEAQASAAGDACVLFRTDAFSAEL